MAGPTGRWVSGCVGGRPGSPQTTYTTWSGSSMRSGTGRRRGRSGLGRCSAGLTVQRGAPAAQRHGQVVDPPPAEQALVLDGGVVGWVGAEGEHQLALEDRPARTRAGYRVWLIIVVPGTVSLRWPRRAPRSLLERMRGVNEVAWRGRRRPVMRIVTLEVPVAHAVYAASLSWRSKGQGFESPQLHSCYVGALSASLIIAGQRRCRGIAADLGVIDYSRAVHRNLEQIWSTGVCSRSVSLMPSGVL